MERIEKMKLKHFIAILLALLLSCSGLVACSKEVVEAPPAVLEPLQTLDQKKLTEYTADAETVAYLSELRDSFSDMQESPESLFEWETVYGGIRITKYLGSAASVRIPASIGAVAVTELADGLFASAEKDSEGKPVKNATLKSLYIPDSVTVIGKGLLENCTALLALRTPLMSANKGSRQSLGYLFGLDMTKEEYYRDNPLSVPASLKYLELGGEMTRIDRYALFECNDLELVTLPESVTELGKFSLYGCTRLIAINTEHLTEIGEHALALCRGLTLLHFGEGLKEIGMGALEGCDELRSLTLPFIGQKPLAEYAETEAQNNYLGYLFGAKVPDFSTGYYPTYLTRITLLSGCTELGNYALYECDMLTELNLPDTLVRIGTRALSGCLYLSKINLPASLTEIGDNAFFGCRSITALDFSATKLKTVGVSAFYYCDSLESVTLPATLTAIPNSCFAQCVKLERINLEHVLTVGAQAFRGCPKINQTEKS